MATAVDPLRLEIGSEDDPHESGIHALRLKDPAVGGVFDLPCNPKSVQTGIVQYNDAVQNAKKYAYRDLPSDIWNRLNSQTIPDSTEPDNFQTFTDAYKRASFLRTGVRELLHSDNFFHRYKHNIGDIDHLFQDIQSRARNLTIQALPCYLKARRKTTFLDIDMTEAPPVVLPGYESQPDCHGPSCPVLKHGCDPVPDFQLYADDMNWHVPYGA